MKKQSKWDIYYSSKKREPFLHLTEEQVDAVLAKFPDAKSALDIGCGEGQLLVQLEQRGILITGIDISSVALDEARKHVRGILIDGDFEQFIFPNNLSFDIIFVKFVIAFIQNPETFFKKINNLLRTGGGFILLTPVTQKLDDSSEKEEIFIKQSILEKFMPQYFSEVEEIVFHSENGKRLMLYVCTKK